MNYILSGILLLISTITDIRKKEISGIVLIIFLILSIINEIVFRNSSLLSIISGIGVGIFILICGYISRENIGYGDGLILVVTGILLGGYENLELLLISLFLSSIIGLFLLVIGKNKKEGIPFIPFMFLAFLIMRGMS